MVADYYGLIERVWDLQHDGGFGHRRDDSTLAILSDLLDRLHFPPHAPGLPDQPPCGSSEPTPLCPEGLNT